MTPLSRVALTAITAITASALTASPAPAQSSTNLVVEQGDATVLGYVLGETCTIAYNDHAKNISYLAGHCGGEDAPTKISLRDSRSGTDAYTDVGYFFPNLKQDWDNPGLNDWGYIRWNSNVTLGANVITGDKILSPHEVEPGEKVCRFGQTTIGNKTKASCGEFILNDPDDYFFLYTSAIPSQRGDSGGPIWVERDGERFFLGPHSGPGQYYGKDDTLQSALRGAIIDYNFIHPEDTGNVDNKTSSATSSTGSSYDIINSSQDTESGEEISSYTASKVWFYIAIVALGSNIAGLVNAVLQLTR